MIILLLSSPQLLVYICNIVASIFKQVHMDKNMIIYSRKQSSSYCCLFFIIFSIFFLLAYYYGCHRRRWTWLFISFRFDYTITCSLHFHLRYIFFNFFKEKGMDLVIKSVLSSFWAFVLNIFKAWLYDRLKYSSNYI